MFCKCNGIFTSKVDYILSQIREIDVIDIFHRNCGNRKEATHNSMAQAHFESYIKFFGEP